MEFVFYKKLNSLFKKIVNQKWILVKESVSDSKLNHVRILTDMKMVKNAVQFVVFLFFMKIVDVHAVDANLELRQEQVNLERNSKKKETW